MLDSCMNINVSTLISKMSQDYNLHFCFYNLDGNKSNFDTFAGELHRFGDKFSFIDLAETNVEAEHKDLYKLSKYNNFYSDKLPNKSSGTGIALYVHDSFSVKVLHDACTTHPHIKTLFAQVKKGNTTLNGTASIDPPTIDPPTIDPPTIDPPTIDPPKIDPLCKNVITLGSIVAKYRV